MSLLEGCKHELEITVPPETVAEETERVVNKLRGRRIPGFRPGKAPASTVKARFADEIRRQVMDTLIPRHLYKQMEDEGLRPVGTPDVSDVSFQPGEPLKFKAEFEVLPNFELQEYRGLEVEYQEADTGEEEIQQALGRIQEKHAVYRNLDPRPLEDGDFALVRLESTATPPGIGPIRQDQLNVELGSEDTLPEFTEGLRGVSPGQTRQVTVTYPDDYGEPRLAGREVTFQIEVLGLRSKDLPELNDELAKDEGDFQTLDQVRDRIRVELEAAKRDQAQRQARTRLVETLVDAHDFPVPETLVDRQTRSNVERGLRSLAEQGMDPTKVRLDWKKIQELEQPRSVREIKAGLILDRIAQQEHLRATQEEVDRQVQAIARQTQQPVAAARARLAEQGALDRIASQIRHEKTLRFLFEQARKIEAQS